MNISGINIGSLNISNMNISSINTINISRLSIGGPNINNNINISDCNSVDKRDAKDPKRAFKIQNTNDVH